MGDRAFDQVQKDFASTTGQILTPEELQNVLTSIPMLCYIPTIFEATSPVCNSITVQKCFLC